MHKFSDLLEGCSNFTIEALNQLEEKTLNELQTNGSTSLVKTLQMIRMEKSILAIGMFSIFEAVLQEGLNCSNGFSEAKSILKKKGQDELLSKFVDLELAINALKHGKGRSYNALVEKNSSILGANVLKPDDNYFFEGDVSEIRALIDVNDKVISTCVQVIRQVSEVVEI